MGVKFQSQSLIPAPLVSIRKDSTRDERGILNGYNYTFTLIGVIVNVNNSKDSPGASGATGMRGVLLGQEYIRNLFNVDAGLLEISDPDTTSDQISAYVKPVSIDFQDDVWVNLCKYNVILTGKYISSSERISDLDSIDENWNVVENEDGTYSVTHQIQARGLLLSTSSSGYNDPLAAAKQWVRSRSYVGNNAGTLTENMSGSGVMNLGNLINQLGSSQYYWNRQSVETVDPINYTWSLNETFLYSSGSSYREDYSVTFAGDTDFNNRLQVSVAGTIIGNAGNIRDYGTRLANARTGFTTVSSNIFARASNLTPVGYTLNPYPTSKQISYSQVPGSVNYSYTYGAMFGTPYVSGAVEEDIQIVDNGFTDVFAIIPVPGRSNGPVIQNMNTSNAQERTIQITAVIAPPSGFSGLSALASRYLSKPNTNDIIDALKPASGYYYIKEDSEQWQPLRGNYSRTVGWVIDAGRISGMPSGIHNLRPSG